MNGHTYMDQNHKLLLLTKQFSRSKKKSTPSQHSISLCGYSGIGQQRDREIELQCHMPQVDLFLAHTFKVNKYTTRFVVTLCVCVCVCDAPILN